MELDNSGLISLLPAHHLGPIPDQRTLVVSGVAGSGIDMVAAILGGAGAAMGPAPGPVDGRDVADRIGHGSLDELQKANDAAHKVWGFSQPQLHRHGTAAIEGLRNPMVVVTVRDPIAVAERYVTPERIGDEDRLSTAMQDLQQTVAFASALSCPVLLVSYEKAMLRPARFVDRLLAFCGLQFPAGGHDRLAGLVRPDRAPYIEAARGSFGGYIDGFSGSVLAGWAYRRSLGQPLTLTVFRDDVPLASCRADRYRQDLEQTGIDDGRRGFVIDLRNLGLKSTSRVSVRVENRSFELNNSGMTAAELGYEEAGPANRFHAPWSTF